MNAMRQKSTGSGHPRHPTTFHCDARRVCLVTMLAFVFAAAPVLVQAQHGAATPDMHTEDAPAISPQIEQQLNERRNLDRQKSLEADTGKLLLLAQQLQMEVAKSNKNQLSITVVKKSEEIEKLARSVKEKMRGY